MKVVMSADAVGGVWTYATELRQALAAEGVEVVIANLGPQAPPQTKTLWYRSRLEWEPGGEADVTVAARWLQSVAHQTAADLVHLNGYAQATLDWELPVLVVAHSCVTSWYEAVRHNVPPDSWDHYRSLVGAGLRQADAVVAPTAAMLSVTRRLYGLGATGCVIHNAVAAGLPSASRREPLILAAGRLWDEAKGLDVLDAAAATLAWPVVVAGEDTGVGADHVRRLGPMPRSRLRERMSSAAIFAHPARYEPFGLAVLEAALAGCALVLGDIPSLRELWDGAAWFVAPGDPDALSHGLASISTDPARRARLADRATERARKYRPDLMARSYAALYRRLVAQRRVAA